MSEWVSTREVSFLLGISENQVRKLRSQGVFKPKTHYRKKNPISARPTYLWHVDRCGDVLGYEPKIRKS